MFVSALNKCKKYKKYRHIAGHGKSLKHIASQESSLDIRHKVKTAYAMLCNAPCVRSLNLSKKGGRVLYIDLVYPTTGLSFSDFSD